VDRVLGGAGGLANPHSLAIEELRRWGNGKVLVEPEAIESVAPDTALYPATTSKVRYGQHSLVDSENSYFERWDLPSYGIANLGCGDVTAKAYCPTCREYKFEFRRSCYRASCPVCYKKWIARETNSATERVFEGLYLLRRESKKHLLHHVVWSVPPSEYHLSYQEQRKRFHYRRKVAGSIAGLVVYHPYRFRALSDGRHVSWKHCSLNPDVEGPGVDSYAVYQPHFHTLSVGYLMNSDKFAERFGWVYKKLHYSVPIWSAKDMRGVIWYLLSHAGINLKFHALSWYGRFSNNQMVIERTSVSYIDMKCPDCETQLWYCAFSFRQREWVKLEDWTIRITKKHYRFKTLIGE